MKLYTFYKITSINKLITAFYIGSTKNLKNRIASHKHNAKAYPDRKVYRYINNNGGFDNFEFITLFTTECSKNKKSRIEASLIINFKASLNIQIPLRTQEQYYSDNIDKIKDYYQANKERRIAYQKEYYRNNNLKLLKEILN